MPVNRPTYAEACRTFRWEDSFKALEWAPAGDVNLGHTILDQLPKTETGKIRRFLLRQQ
jgi:acyl-CoA synthetase (AMP-forming)/AMP-acid ligase II